MEFSREEIKDKLIDIMKMVMQENLPETDDIGDELELVNDLGLNSVGVLYVVIAIEEFFCIEFENVGFNDFKTVGDVVNYIEEYLN